MNVRSTGAIWNFDFGMIAERCLAEHPELAERYSDYEYELRRFFNMIAQNDCPLAMFSPKIDVIWHSFIMFTPLYRKFCDQAFGSYIDHIPRTSKTPIPEQAIWNFFECYERQFGEVPSLWFDGLPPKAASDLKDRKVPEALLWSGWAPRNWIRSLFPGTVCV